MKICSILPRISGVFAVLIALGFFSVACVGERPELGEEVNVSALLDDAEQGVIPNEADYDAALGGAPVERRSIRLAFGGNASFQGLETDWVNDPEALLREVAPLFAGADFAMVNLEAALGATGSPIEKTHAFQAPREVLIALRAAGIHAATMANDHGMDFGRQGFEDSLRASEELWFPVIGIGHNDTQAYSPIRSDIDGTQITVFAANDVFDDRLESEWTATADHGGLASIVGDQFDKFVQLVTAEAETADVVVVYLHFGPENDACPTDRQSSVAQRLIDAGADIIIGAHSQQLQGMGYRNGSFVAYGLSNFIASPQTEAGARSGVLVLDVAPDNSIIHEWRPALIRDALPRPLNGEERDVELTYMNDLLDCTGLDREFSHE